MMIGIIRMAKMIILMIIMVKISLWMIRFRGVARQLQWCFAKNAETEINL